MILRCALLSLLCLVPAHACRAKEVRDVVGVVHVAGQYHLTDRDFLNEGADQILALGSRVIKVWFFSGTGDLAKSYPYNSQWPQVGSLVEGAQTPYFSELFNKPFNTYILKVTSLGRDEGYWRKGITDEQKQDEQRQFYGLAKHLLTRYKGTGKTFVLQHWEGDWMVRGNFDGNAQPTESALQNMIEWLNARQGGVDQARTEVGQQGVHVYHAAEVNRVVQSMREGFPNVVNKVLPHTRLDLVSYSAWDSATEHHADPNVLRQALDFIAANTPDSPDFGNRNVYIGEFGMPENHYMLEQIRTAVPNAVRTGLDWGCPYVVYWQLYCNEMKDPNAKPPVQSNDAVRGFWLIRPDGTKSWLWDYFQDLKGDCPNPVRQWPFGFGLSYSKIAYHGLKVDVSEMTPAATLTATVQVTNESDRPAKEIVQLYLSDVVASVTPPVKVLKRYQKVDLAPKATQTVRFTLGWDDLAFIGRDNKPVVEPGEFKVQIGDMSVSFNAVEGKK